MPVVFNSPHSGNRYPASFVASSRLDPLTLRKSEDALVDELLEPVLALGAPVLKANFPRALLDVNREPYELDPSMFATTLPDYVNTSSLRVAGGLGTIPRVVSETDEIYSSPLSFSQAEARIRDLYLPYHRALERLLDEVYDAFGTVFLIDCHSMPSTGLSERGFRMRSRPDVVLGDRYGSTCSPDLVRCLEGAFREEGYSVVRNKPYAGGHITQIYSQRSEGRHTIQVEINRALYMDEASIQPHGGFLALRDDLGTVFGRVLRALPDILRPTRLAAE
ncbi:MAG: N-formylglutamate amidohydrolase [Pseudomonadota bacterium]